jgi:hypothetical protein
MLLTLKRLALTLFATLALGAVLLPAAPASAAPEPWWQVLTGSRPTNLWEPQNQIQEIDAPTTAFVLRVNGSVVGLFNPPFPEASATNIQTALEGAYGAGNVEVTGGPGGTAPLIITWIGEKAGQAVAPVEILAGGSTKILQAGGSGNLVLTLTNLGDAPVDASSTPVQIVDELPNGVEATDVRAIPDLRGGADPLNCELNADDLVTCTFEGSLASYEAIEIEISVSLTGKPPVSGTSGKVSVSGGNAAAASAVQDITVSPEPTPFGIEHFSAQTEEEGGTPVVHAGKHPFQLTTTIQLNSGHVSDTGGGKRNVEQPALPRNLRFPLPAGLVGNAKVMPQCPMAIFLVVNPDTAVNECADSTALGVASVTIVPEGHGGLSRVAVPVFNLPPALGEPARLGIMVLGTPVVIDTEVNPDNHYRITASVRNVSQVAKFFASTVVLWGTPGDPRHDSSRGWNCAYYVPQGPCQRPANLGEEAFFRQPVSCAGPLEFGAEIEPWNVSLGTVVDKEVSTSAPMIGCNQVPFNPEVQGSATSKLASNPSGFDFRLDMPNSGLLDKDAIAEGQAKKVEVILPEGMTINPSQGNGLVGCSPADLARETSSSKPGDGCPQASKVGEVQISTPLLSEEARGSLYVASPYDNPFDSLLALYMVARIPERGILIMQAGVVKPDLATGQLVTVFDDLPQLPFTSFKLHFREGGRAPLVTPPACGDYDIVTRFTPWSAADPNNPTPSEIVTRTSSFKVERGVDGGACPDGGKPPFHPGLEAGTINNSAKSYSPFNVRLTREDGEQEFTNFSVKLPPGLTGKLAGIDKCSDVAIAAAKGRTGPNGGLEEIQSPSCPANSQVGRTLVGAGVGATLTYVPGKIYLAGPFNGAPLSFVSITPARVGPFDLGNVVLRLAVRINPETAEVFVDPTGSDPIPHIIQGIPVHARDIRAYVDRPEFTLNPTSCEPTSTASTVLGSGLDFGSASDDQPVTVTSPFQAADCASLGFKPQLKLQLLGGTKRGDTPRLKAVLTPRKGDANIGRAQVTLPHSAFLEQAHIRTVCTRVQFNAGGGNGEQCPKGSVYGKAKAITPLLDDPAVGKVYLRSSDNELPDLVAALRSGGIAFNLVGRIDSLNGRIRNTFDAPPDVPVTKFTLEMQGGQKGLIVNSTNICKGKHHAIATLKGQNGRRHEFKPVVKAKCGGKKSKKSRAR